MVRGLAGAFAALLWCSAGDLARAEPQYRYDDIITRLAETHGVPETLVHRVVMRESRYNPALVHRQCYGLMQIKHATARAMGYKGTASQLLDARVNLTYGVPYLANAYRLSGGDPDRALRLYSSGYYYVAKRLNLLGEMRNASSAEVAPEPAPQAVEPAKDPITRALSFLAGPSSASGDAGP